MKEQNHLPTYGPGPIYVSIISVLTVIGIFLSTSKVLKSGNIEALWIPFALIGIALIVFGVMLWISAVFGAKIDDGIKNNKLITTGPYAHVRNPIYSAIAIAEIGVIFICNNLWLLVLPFIYWGLLTIILKSTEEKWLKDLYGEEYVDYCKRVNRCIPWFKRKQKKKAPKKEPIHHKKK